MVSVLETRKVTQMNSSTQTKQTETIPKKIIHVQHISTKPEEKKLPAQAELKKTNLYALRYATIIGK